MIKFFPIFVMDGLELETLANHSSFSLDTGGLKNICKTSFKWIFLEGKKQLQIDLLAFDNDFGIKVEEI